MSGYDLLKVLSGYDDDELKDMSVYIYNNDQVLYKTLATNVVSIDQDGDLIFDTTL